MSCHRKSDLADKSLDSSGHWGVYMQCPASAGRLASTILCYSGWPAGPRSCRLSFFLAAALSLSRPELIRTCGYGWGRHAAQWSSEELFVRLRSPDPSAFTTYISELPSRSDAKAIWLPFGDHTGNQS